MPATGQGSGTGSPPVNILIGRNAPTTDVTNLIDVSSLRIEETGNQAGATLDAVLLDRSQTFAQMRGEWRIVVNWKNPVTGHWRPMFRGFIRSPSPEAKAIYGELAVHAEDCGGLLDRLVVGRQGVGRPAGESDKKRIQWLFGGLEHADGVKVAQPLLAEGFADWSKVQVLNADMPKQRFGPRLTLRQALERILSQASDSADYFIDHEPRLWTFDSDTAAAVLDTAPYAIHMTAHPGAGKVAPHDLVVEWDTDNLWTGYYASGASPKVSGLYVDSNHFDSLSTGDLPGPYGVHLFGRRIGNFNAPDADTKAKVQRAVKAALRDTRNPVPRVTFSVEGTSCYEAGTGDRWRGGQRLYITSVVHGLNGSGADAGPWAGSDGSAGALLQPFRIKRVTTSFLSGKGDMRCEVEAGGRRKVLYSGGT